MTAVLPAGHDSGPRFGARAHLGLGLFFLALAIYGSLVPFHYKPVPWDEAMLRWEQVHWIPLGIERRSDFVANILLFIPLGYFFVASLCVDQSPLLFIPAAVLILPLLAGLAVAIEFTQIWFEPRTVSVNDMVAESLGGAIGAALWLVVGRRITTQTRRLLAALGRREIATQLLPLYLAFLVLIHVMPFDLTISPVEVWHKYKEGRVVLVPFSAHVSAIDLFYKTIWTIAYFLPVGFLLSGVRTRRPLTALQVASGGLLLAGAITFLKLFVWTRYSDVTDALVGGLAVLGGWYAGRGWMTRTDGLPSLLASRTAILVLWIGVLAVANWYPFDFIPDLSRWRERWSEVQLVPFSDLYVGSEYHAFDQILHKTLMFLPVGGLLARPGRSILPGLAAGLVLSCLLEAGQLGLPTRFTSVTDVLVETSAAAVGCYLARRTLMMLDSPPPGKSGMVAYPPVAAH